MSDARIRISLSSGELEIAGSESFIDKYSETLNIMLQRLREEKPSSLPTGSSPPDVSVQSSRNPGQFGEALLAFSNSATDTDRMLLAGAFAQGNSADNTFATGEASQLLIEQGIKPSNPSQCMTNNLKAKRVFKVGSRYRVSKQGEDHLRKLGA